MLEVTMKKISMLLVLLMMVGLMAACSGQKDSSDDKEKEEATKVEASKDDSTEKEVEEKDTEKSSNEVEEEKDVVEEEAKSFLDKSLEGAALLATIAYDPPKELQMTTEMTGMGTNSTAITYYSGDNSRTETTSEDFGTQIVIYNAKDEVTYQYTEGEEEGILMPDGEDEDGGMGMSFETPTFADLVDASSEDIEARVEDLDGEEVIYVRSVESDPDYGDMEVLMWYSVKYSVPLKYEMYMSGSLMMSNVVTEIEAGKKADPKLFEKPEGIEFTEIDLDNLFNF